MKPRKQAGYMTAPDQIAIASKIILATQGPSIHDSGNVAHAYDAANGKRCRCHHIHRSPYSSSSETPIILERISTTEFSLLRLSPCVQAAQHERHEGVSAVTRG
jgi:hypothetical protein